MDAAGTIPGAEHIAYTLQWDASKAVTEKGDPNTFLMKGNLFFVWEGIAGSDATIQTNIRYIHSDGKGDAAGQLSVFMKLSMEIRILRIGRLSRLRAVSLQKAGHRADGHMRRITGTGLNTNFRMRISMSYRRLP